MIFNFYDTFTVEVTGEGKVKEEIAHTYQEFEVEEGRETDLAVEVEAFDYDPDEILGEPFTNYARKGDRFLMKNRHSTFSVSEDWSHVRCDPNAYEHELRAIIETEVRKRMAEDGLSLIHASGAVIDGKTVLFPSWRHTGKTNTLISLLFEGAQYLGDDRLWIDGDGRTLGYNVPIHTLYYNLLSFPGFADGAFQRAKARAASKLDLLMLGREENKKMFHATRLFNEVVFKGSEMIELQELFPDAQVGEVEDVDHLVLLRTGDDEVSVEDCSGEEMKKSLAAINAYEWDHDMMEVARAFDSLFPAQDRTGELEGVVENDREVFKRICGRVETHKLYLPREEEWDREELNRQLVATVKDLAGV